QAVGVVTLTISGTQSGTDPFALGAGISLSANGSGGGAGSLLACSYDGFTTQGVTFSGGAASGATRSVDITTVNDALLEGPETVRSEERRVGKDCRATTTGNTNNTTTNTDDETATLAIAATSTAAEARTGNRAVR